MLGSHTLRTTSLLGAAAVTALALAACASSGGSSSSVSHASNGAAQLSAGSSGERAKAASAPDGTVSAAALQAAQDQLARRASIAIKVKDIGQAVARVRATTAANDGLVLSENIGTSTGGIPLQPGTAVTATTYGEITISVPESQLDPVVDDLGRLGTVIRSQSSSENVGAQIVDTDARLKTMNASVERVRALMTRATDLTQIVNLESELSRRQADLEALESQLASLKDSVARSPIEISLTTDPGVIARKADTGFVAGLKGGWQAFTSSVTVVLTILGAVLPFAVVAAAIAVPLWWALRRRRASQPTPPAPQAVSAG